MADIDRIALARQELEKTAEGLTYELELARSKVKILEDQSKTVKAAIKAMTPKSNGDNVPAIGERRVTP